MKTFLLEIVTPYKRYFSGEVEYLSLTSSKGVLGILPNHIPLICDVLICEISLKINGKVEFYSTSGGILNIKKEKTTLLLESIENKNEIDIVRAQEAKKRADERLERAKSDAKIDIARAESALSRALNRIKVYSK